MSISSALQAVTNGTKQRAFLSDGTSNILFNVLSEYTESDTCEITDHAVESGATITDHIWLRPKEISLTIVLTDDDMLQLMQEGITASDFIKTIDDRMDQLDQWLKGKVLLNYYGRKGDYKNVAIQSVDRTRSSDVGDGLALDISLKRITIATSSTVSVSFAGQTASGSTNKSGKLSSKESKSSVANDLISSGL